MLGPYHQIVSLGRSCQPAHQIRKILDVRRASVFDWLVTSDRGLCQLIATGLDGLFQPETLQQTPTTVIHAPTGTQFVHEFPAGTSLHDGHARNKGRIAHLIQRWQALMASDASILFVRHHGWNDDSPARADDLSTVLAASAPRLRFRLLYLTEPQHFRPMPDTDRLLHRPLPQPPDGDWRGLTTVWEQLLDEALFLDPPP